jgi:hypothetical protein
LDRPIRPIVPGGFSGEIAPVRNSFHRGAIAGALRIIGILHAALLWKRFEFSEST